MTGDISETNGATQNGAAHSAPEETPASKFLTLDDFREALTVSLSPFISKINGEQAKLRKQLEALRGGGKDGQAESPSPAGRDAPQALSLSDLKHWRELSKLEARAESLLAPEELAEVTGDLDGVPVEMQVRILRAALRGREPGRAAGAEAEPQEPGREARHERKPARVESSAARASDARPRTKLEFAELRRKDPKAAQRLIADPGFDLSSLPFK